MPDKLENIVQKMIDAGESEENIASVIKEYNFKYPVVKKEVLRSTPIKKPITFWGGVGNSLTSGEAFNAGLEGAGGFIRGAIADLPSSLMNTLGMIGDLSWNSGGIGAGGIGVRPIIKDIPQGLRNIYNTTVMAGSEPGNFGRMSGQITGQPLVTAGLAKTIPEVPGTIGPHIGDIGRVMSENQPASGLLPRFAYMRTLRALEKKMGEGLQGAGRYMEGRKPVEFIDKSTPTQTLDIRPQQTINQSRDVAQPTGIDWERIRRLFKP